MANTEKLDELSRVPTRADARRNWEKLIEAAREAFAEEGSATSLESIAKRAGVGIGTLYRHFPTREDLFKSVYVEGVKSFCETASGFENLDPWDAWSSWLRKFVEYAATKRALAQELMRSFGHSHESGMFAECRASIYASGEPLMKRAQQAGVVRKDLAFDDALRLISGITIIEFTSEAQREHVINIALDGLRYHD